MTKLTTTTGEVIDFADAWARNATAYAREKGLLDVAVGRAKDEYVIFQLTDNNQNLDPVYASQQFEAIGVHLDMMAADRSFDAQESDQKADNPNDGPEKGPKVGSEP